MPVFMFASGYLFIYTRNPEHSYFRFLKKKVQRLLLPYLSTSVIIITIKLLTENNLSVDNPVTFYSYLKIFYLPEAGYFLWYIWALWWMFVLVGLCRKTIQLWILTILFTALHFLPLDITELFALKTTTYYAVYFLTGVMTYTYRQQIQKLIMIPNYIIYLSFVVLEIFYTRSIGTVFQYPCYQILSFLGIATVMRVSFDMTLCGKSHLKWLLQVSSCSYMIYLLHTTFEGFAKAASMKITGIPDTEVGFLCIASFSIIFGLTFPILLQNKLFSRFKVTRMLFGLK